jgi:hypothetical protein
VGLVRTDTVVVHGKGGGPELNTFRTREVAAV